MAGYIIDNSVWSRIKHHPAVGHAIEGLDDVIYTCTPQRLEFLYSARSATDHARMVAFLDRVGVYLEPPPGLDALCVQIQSALAAQGKLRAVGPIDVMIAAHALANRLTVVHYDSDFADHLGKAVPGFRQQWVVAPGSL